MKKIVANACMLLAFASSLMAQSTPDKIYGQLFTDVQTEKVFGDSKTFVDCTPKRKVADILYDYGLAKSASLDLKKFVADNFNVPGNQKTETTQQEKDVVAHINNLWATLKRDADKKENGSSLLPLPYPYIVPGGRFREIYYWDSYFTMLGLKQSGEVKMIENMVDNFAFLINTYGHIPNGNRSYYLSRSQPPFFCLMVELLAGIKGNQVYKKYLPAMQKEYDYWMEGSASLKNDQQFKRTVKLKDGILLNRYWDDLSIPRQEGYREDVKTADEAVAGKMMTMRFASEAAMNNFRQTTSESLYKNLRAGACSGWDFSSRWFAEPAKISTIQILDILPIDLNCLLYKMETVLATSYKLSRQDGMSSKLNAAAAKRMKAIDQLFFSESLQFYSDYNFKLQQPTGIATAAALYPLTLLNYSQSQFVQKGILAKSFIETYLLKDGGLLSTPNTTGQQWDAPNGWAPLQWMAVTGLERANQKALAKDIAGRWIKLNSDVYQRTGKLMEKYNVVNTRLEAGGGEYAGQDGFGWTNGVLLDFIKKYGTQKNYAGSINKN